jgi:hypothetical protein
MWILIKQNQMFTDHLIRIKIKVNISHLDLIYIITTVKRLKILEIIIISITI